MAVLSASFSAGDFNGGGGKSLGSFDTGSVAGEEAGVCCGAAVVLA